MTDSNLVEYNLPGNAYASFDAVSLKQLIIQRLSESDVFRDQVFEGSNLNSLIDIVAFMYHVLLFQLNQNAAEGVFTQATIYENMNKLVSLLNYKPTGLQTAFVEFSLTAAAGLPVGSYLIKRFSSVNADGYNYTLVTDVNFEKAISNEEEALSFTDTVLYQGTITEYPPYIATGEPFENITIAFENLVDPNKGNFIGDNTFSIFVKESNDGKWYIYNETPSLYLNLPGDRVYEKRFNENGRYEIKFGDGVTGKSLNVNDLVGIYFIVSDGQPGQISANDLANKTLLPFNSTQFAQIVTDIYTQDVTLLQDIQYSLLALDNDYASTFVADGETVDQIRVNAPKIFSAQNRAVTLADYKAIVDKNFSYILASTQPVNNKYYVDTYIKYFYDIGLGQPNDDTGVLVNQLNFMTSTNFNNIYLFMVPKFGTIRNEITPVSLSVAQKQLVINELNKVKSATHEVVPLDPVYKAFSFGLPLPGETISLDIKNETFLVIKRSDLSKQARQKIKNDVVTAIQNYFSVSNSELGQVVDITALSNTILSIEGVSSISTRRVTPTTSLELPSISLLYWNPFYTQADVNISAQNIPLELFEFPYLYEQSQIVNKILVEDE
jgi:hypothetical protein